MTQDDSKNEGQKPPPKKPQESLTLVWVCFGIVLALFLVCAAFPDQTQGLQKFMKAIAITKHR